MTKFREDLPDENPMEILDRNRPSQFRGADDAIAHIGR